MASFGGRIGGSLSVAAKKALEFTGLRRSRLGRVTIALLNVVLLFIIKKIWLRSDRPVLIGGHRLYLDQDNPPSVAFTAAFFNGEYEPETTRLFETLLRPGMTVLDVGAHVGYYSMLAARLVGPAGHVCAFEPDPRNCGLLRRNIELNGYGNIEVVPSAVADREGVILLFRSSLGSDQNSISSTSQGTLREEAVPVPAMTLDEFARSTGSPKIDFIKMDVEGCEPLALIGMRQLIAATENLTFVVEFNTERLQACGFVPRDFLRDLQHLGFDIQCVGEHCHLTTLDPSAYGSFTAGLQGKQPVNLLCIKRLVPQSRQDDVDVGRVVPAR